MVIYVVFFTGKAQSEPFRKAPLMNIGSFSRSFVKGEVVVESWPGQFSAPSAFYFKVP